MDTLEIAVCTSDWRYGRMLLPRGAHGVVPWSSAGAVCLPLCPVCRPAACKPVLSSVAKKPLTLLLRSQYARSHPRIMREQACSWAIVIPSGLPVGCLWLEHCDATKIKCDACDVEKLAELCVDSDDPRGLLTNLTNQHALSQHKLYDNWNCPLAP